MPRKYLFICFINYKYKGINCIAQKNTPRSFWVIFMCNHTKTFSPDQFSHQSQQKTHSYDPVRISSCIDYIFLISPPP